MKKPRYKKFQDVIRSPYIAHVKCRRCGVEFISSDKRSVTRCDLCREWMYNTADEFSEDSLYDFAEGEEE